MPGPIIVKPQPGDEISSTWGTSVADSLNGIQVGTVLLSGATSTVTVQATVTFPRPYAAPPFVLMASPHVAANGAADTVTTTGFRATARRVDGSASTYQGNYPWIAVGTLA